MKITFETKKATDQMGLNVPGICFSWKTPEIENSIKISKENDFDSIDFSEMTTSTGKRITRRKLPFGWQLKTSRSPRISSLVGIPPNLTMDDVVSFFGEEFPTLVRGALKFALDYGWSKVDDPEEYRAIISVLEGKHHQEPDLTEEERDHQEELFQKLLDGEREFGKFCSCKMCEDITQKEVEAERLNNKVFQETMKRIYRIIPQLGD